MDGYWNRGHKERLLSELKVIQEQTERAIHEITRLEEIPTERFEVALAIANVEEKYKGLLAEAEARAEVAEKRLEEARRNDDD